VTLSALSLCATLWAATSTSTAAADAPTVELVVFAPGEAIYTLWGHAAIRVVDPVTRQDLAYNFGSIDFSGAFFARMMRGEVDAFVAVAPYHAMAEVYRREERSIRRLTLDLTPEEARHVAAELAARTADGPSHYRYHHFEDNCSTQVADTLDRALGGRLSHLAQGRSQATLRRLALGYLRRDTLLYVAVDTLLTAPVDRPITVWHTTFLPEELAKVLRGATTPAGRPLVRSELLEFRGRDADLHPQWTWPWTKVYLLFVAPLLFLALRFARVATLLWTLVAGLSGCVLAVAWLGTGYDFLHGNWNLIALPPTHLLAGAVLLKTRWRERWILRRGVRVYAGLHLAALIGLTVGVITGAVPQAVGPVLGLAFGPAAVLLSRRYRTS
jgi:hypothetical protein